MQTLRLRSFNAYRANLAAVEERALRGFRKKVARAAHGFMTAPDEEDRSVYRSLIIDEVYGRIDVGRDQAQAIADDLYEEMNGVSPHPHDPFPLDAADARVRSAAVHLFERGDVRRFIEVLETFIRQEVRGAASSAVAENVEEGNK